MKLYSYARSTTSYRVRAALNLKSVPYGIETVDLMAGDQLSTAYQAIHPGKSVPSLMLDDGTVLTQSLAIIDYLDTVWPNPPLLSGDPVTRARMLAVAMTAAADIHPVNNLRVLEQLRTRFDAQEDQCEDWMRHWMAEGFDTTEALLPDRYEFAFADAPGLADLCITAQAYNAHRWGFDLGPFPKIARIEKACLALPQIAAAHPDHAPAPKETA